MDYNQFSGAVQMTNGGAESIIVFGNPKRGIDSNPETYISGVKYYITYNAAQISKAQYTTSALDIVLNNGGPWKGSTAISSVQMTGPSFTYGS